MALPPKDYWTETLYLNPRQRPKADQPIRDLPERAAGRFRRAREGIRALRHVTEQVVFLGMEWKWVWMYEVGGRKLAFVHPMRRGVSGTFVLHPAEERELATTEGIAAVVRQSIRDGAARDGVRWCWMAFDDLDMVDAFVDVIRRKHQFLARPE